jgi:hypothetical protein
MEVVGWLVRWLVDGLWLVGELYVAEVLTSNFLKDFKYKKNGTWQIYMSLRSMTFIFLYPM